MKILTLTKLKYFTQKVVNLISTSIDNAVKTIKADLSSVYRYKGSVDTYDQLPTEGNEPGDVYDVKEAYGDYPAGTNFAYTGTGWDALGGKFDGSEFIKRSEWEEATEEDIDKLFESE